MSKQSDTPETSHPHFSGNGIEATAGSQPGMRGEVDLSALCSRFLAAQLLGDHREALRLILDACQPGASVIDLQLKVIQEAQHELGRLWEQDRINIAQEHMATAIAQLVLAHLYQQATPTLPFGQRIIVAWVEGELHEFSARRVGDALDLAGFTVKYLGANVPTDSLLAVIEQEKPDLLALSVTMIFNVQPVARTGDQSHPRRAAKGWRRHYSPRAEA